MEKRRVDICRVFIETTPYIAAILYCFPWSREKTFFSLFQTLLAGMMVGGFIHFLAGIFELTVNFIRVVIEIGPKALFTDYDEDEPEHTEKYRAQGLPGRVKIHIAITCCSTVLFFVTLFG